MENIVLNCENIAKKKLVYPVTSPECSTSGNTEETNAIALILITLAMLALTFAVAVKIVTVLIKAVLGTLKNQFNWLFIKT